DPHRLASSLNRLEPPNVPGDFFEALALIQGVAGVVVGQAIEMDIRTPEAFEMLNHAAQHFPAQAAPLKVPAYRQDIDESQRGIVIDRRAGHRRELAIRLANEHFLRRKDFS